VADAGHDQGVGAQRALRVARDLGVGADVPQRALDRQEVAHAEVEDRDRHRVPFVLGITPPRPVRLHASPSAFAMPLNAASST
jgi:hypothetical protein